MSGIQPEGSLRHRRPGPDQRGATPGKEKRTLPWLVRGNVGAFVVAAFVALACCLVGPDPRYLLLRKGMTEAHVQALLGKPTYYDRTENDAPGWYYAYDFTEIIVEWDGQGRVSKVRFLW